jgi:ligand-binding sensor domain-containing protein/two-component sensor histidine kinase
VGVDVFGQSDKPYFREIGSAFGLPTAAIYDLFVASDGLLYLGTEKGLYAYDGTRFRKFEFVESLAVGVNGITEDSEGRIWCKNFSSQIFYSSGNRLILEQHSANFLNSTASNLCDFDIFNDDLYIATEHQVVRISSNGKTKSLFQITFKNFGEAITSIQIDKISKVIFVATTVRNIALKIEKETTVLLSNSIRKKSGQTEITNYQNKPYCIIKAENNSLANYEEDYFSTDGFNLGSFINLSEATGKLWLCTSTGVYELDAKKKKIEKEFLTNIRATDILSDHENNIWVSTYRQGLIFVPNQGISRLDLQDFWGCKKVNFTCITKDSDGNFYVGTDNGKIVQFDKYSKHQLTYDSGEDREIEFVYVNGNQLLTSRGIFEIGNPRIIKSSYLGKDICPDAFGNYLIATYRSSGIISQGLGKASNLPQFLIGKLKGSSFSDDSNVIVVLKSKRARAVHFEKSTSTYYVGSSNGLFIFSEKLNSEEIRDEFDKPIIAAQIAGDKDGCVWVATVQRGLYKIKDDRVVLHINRKNGLIDNQCKKLRITDDAIWLVTDGGLHFINKSNFHVKNLSTQAGINGLMINDIELLNDKIILATNEGILLSSTSNMLQDVMPNFRFTEVKSNNQIIQSGSRLSYNQNNITLKFQTIHFRSMGNFTYQYRLKNVDPSWMMQDSKIQEVTYRSLKPGNYTFEARVLVGDLVSPIQRFSFSIGKPFWLTYWFISLCAIALFGFVYWYLSWRIKKIQDKQRIREQLALSQITALRAQMNPHFMFNILNAFQGLIYTNQKTRANEYLGVFSDLMRKTLDISDQKEITILDEIEAVELYVELEKARFENDDFHFILEVEDKDELNNYLIPSLILQPFVENAIKHGLLHKDGKKVLTMRIIKEYEHWLFEIEDNGIGRKKSMEWNQKFHRHKSFATKAIDSRIELINKLNKNPILIDVIDLYDENLESIGTRVQLKIPLKPKVNESYNS